MKKNTINIIGYLFIIFCMVYGNKNHTNRTDNIEKRLKLTDNIEKRLKLIENAFLELLTEKT